MSEKNREEIFREIVEKSYEKFGKKPRNLLKKGLMECLKESPRKFLMNRNFREKFLE